MGFETFRVELHGGKAPFAEANESVRKLSHVKPDPDSLPMKGSTYYVREDGQHAIEIEVTDSPVRLSCRFTLCHPASIDAAFLGLVQELMLRLGMEVTICDDVEPAMPRPYALAEFPEFLVVTRHYIAARRAEWIAAFGDQPLAATTNMVYQQIILPQCRPGIQELT